MSAIDVFIAGPLAAMTVGGVVFAGLGAACARLWLAERLPEVDERKLPPLTLLRPVKPEVPSLRERLDELARAMRPGDQLILGADEGSAELAMCEALRAEFPDREIVVVSCARGRAINPKISKLVQMDAHVRHEHLILSDSEAMIDAATLDAFRREWLASGAGAITAPYRFAGMTTAPQCADAVALLLSFWPGLALVRALGQVRFTLGACTGLRRADLVAVGGWSAFGDFLAEDHRLGAALAEHGTRLRLSVCVVTLASDPMTWQDFRRHQRRVAVTWRVCSPRGFAGLIATHGISAGVLMLVLAPFSDAPVFWSAWALVAFAVRCFVAWMLARVVRMKIPDFVRAIPIAALVETDSWVRSWTSPVVWWAGEWRRVTWDGRMRDAQPGKG